MPILRLSTKFFSLFFRVCLFACKFMKIVSAKSFIVVQLQLFPLPQQHSIMTRLGRKEILRLRSFTELIAALLY